MPTTSTAPPLPAGWLWDFDEETKRWRFIHIDTEHKQPHFPNIGDELLASQTSEAPASLLSFNAEQEQSNVCKPEEALPATKAKDVPPAYSTLEPITTLSATSVIAVQETNPVDGVSQLTASVASITIEPQLRPNRKAVRNLRRKPIGDRADASPMIVDTPIEQNQHARLPYQDPPIPCDVQPQSPIHSVFEAPVTREPSLKERPAELMDTREVGTPIQPQDNGMRPQSILLPGNAQTPSATISPQATQSFAPMQSLQNTPGIPNVLHSSPPLAAHGLQTMAPLQPVQTAPAPANTLPQEQRPSLSTIQSAPDVMQIDMNHTAATPVAESKRSRLSKMSKGVGDWAKKHPKMAIGSAVMVEIAGLAAGVDLAKDAQAIQRMKQTVKRGMGARPTNPLSAANNPASKPAPQAGQQAAHQQTQQHTQQQIQQAAHQQTQRLLQQLLQQQAAAGQPLQFQPASPGYFQPASPTHLYGSQSNIPNQYQNMQAGQSAQQQQNPAQMQQNFVHPAGNFASTASPTGKVQQNGMPTSQAAQQQVAYQPQSHAAPQPQQTSGGFGDPANNLANMYQNHQQAQQQQAQQQTYQQQTQQLSSGLGDLANNLATAYQNNQASQQQAAYQQQITQQQIAYIQQQSAAQQQTTQAQISQFNQQAAMFQSPYGIQQQPVYIDNSGGGSGGLADALALATLMDPSSTSNPTTVTTTDPGVVPDPTIVADPSTTAYSGDPVVAEQIMEEEQVAQSESIMAWSSMDDSAALELI